MGHPILASLQRQVGNDPFLPMLGPSSIHQWADRVGTRPTLPLCTRGPIVGTSLAADIPSVFNDLVQPLHPGILGFRFGRRHPTGTRCTFPGCALLIQPHHHSHFSRRRDRHCPTCRLLIMRTRAPNHEQTLIAFLAIVAGLAGPALVWRLSNGRHLSLAPSIPLASIRQNRRASAGGQIQVQLR